MAEKKRSSKAKPKARVRKSRARKAEAAGATPQEGYRGALLYDPFKVGADLSLINRAIANGWKVPERTTLIAENVLEIFECPDDYKVEQRLAAVSTLLAMRRDNRDEVRLALQVRKDKREQKKLKLEEQKQNAPPVNVNILNQQANVSTNAISSEQRAQEMDAIEARCIERIGSQAVDAIDAGREGPVGTVEGIPTVADDAGGNATGQVAGGIAPLRFD